MTYQNTRTFAEQADLNDPLASFRSRFHFPSFGGSEMIYFTGNSLGLQPKAARELLLEELDDWAYWGVEGHFHAQRPWKRYHEFFTESAARLVGARNNEVVMMNGLTTNIHLLMVSFYRPTAQRFKIVCEQKAFPSDQYALESQVRHHGLDPSEAIIEVAPRPGEHTIRHEDILTAIDRHKDQLALVFIGGVNYYTGQVFDMQAITKAGRAAGAFVGFDLAHAAGNIILRLHDWEVDFACWCTYKYLNSGPGSIAGAFIHERHALDKNTPRFAGWWGYEKSTRFLMQPGFDPIPTAEGWQLSNAPVMSMAPHLASLRIFDEVGMEALANKAQQLTGYLDFVIKNISAETTGCDFEIITPEDPKQRGCQISLLVHGRGKDLFDALSKAGVVADWREPNVIRMAPVPLYNSYTDVLRFGQILTQALK